MIYKRIKHVDGREGRRKGGKTEKGTESGLINDKRETSNQSIKLSSTHAVWKGRIWWVISIDKDNQCSTVSTYVLVKGLTSGFLDVFVFLLNLILRWLEVQFIRVTADCNYLFLGSNKYQDNGKVSWSQGVWWSGGLVESQQHKSFLISCTRQTEDESDIGPVLALSVLLRLHISTRVHPVLVITRQAGPEQTNTSRIIGKLKELYFPARTGWSLRCTNGFWLLNIFCMFKTSVTLPCKLANLHRYIVKRKRETWSCKHFNFCSTIKV